MDCAHARADREREREREREGEGEGEGGAAIEWLVEFQSWRINILGGVRW